MPRFPAREDKIVDLARQIFIGLKDNMLIWPGPPVSWFWIYIKMFIYKIRHRNLIAARAAAAAAYTTQQKTLATLVTALKKNLRYAENTVNFDDHKLKLIGWSGKRTARPVEPPGQVRQLKITRLTNGQVKLLWQSPLEGGMVDAYEVQRRQSNDSSEWRHIATALTGEMILRDQSTGDYQEYRIRAINKVGHGQVSNTVIHQSQMIMS